MARELKLLTTEEREPPADPARVARETRQLAALPEGERLLTDAVPIYVAVLRLDPDLSRLTKTGYASDLRQFASAMAILEYAQDLVSRVDTGPRTHHIQPTTVDRLSQLALLSSRILRRHVRLSDVVDLAVRLFCQLAPDEQDVVITGNRRRRRSRRA